MVSERCSYHPAPSRPTELESMVGTNLQKKSCGQVLIVANSAGTFVISLLGHTCCKAIEHGLHIICPACSLWSCL